MLKQKLESEGLFAPDRKRPLPQVPQRVAVISSTQAAGYADFVKILNDRWGGVSLSVAQVQVQGADAPDQIIRAIEFFNQSEPIPEVLVIIRGGGSADDLAAFNDEPLARAIASSRIPTLVGVGHETDESLADLVSDVRAATPSNAAQILVPDKNEVIRSVRYQLNSLLPKVDFVITQQNAAVRSILVRAIERIEDNLDNKLSAVGNIQTVLSHLDPSRILARGYSIVRGQIKTGSIIEVETNKVILKAEVKNVSSK
jgi:exodeoxyribonuclease VII large subunit